MTGTSATQSVDHWLRGFAAALEQGDIDRAVEMFAPECFWGDFVAFSWNLKTAEGIDEIRAMLTGTLAAGQPSRWAIDGEATAGNGFVQAWLRFETKAGTGKGHVRLKDGRCWTLFTSLHSLRGFEEKTGRNGTREAGTQHGQFRNRESWLERRTREAAELGTTRQPYCVIVGGGQGGIALAARLRRLEVPTIVIERNARAGDSWRKRYRSLCLHDPVWYDHLPYLPFPDHWPIFSPKDQLGDWLEVYTRIMELDYWTGTECLGAQFDPATQTWQLRVRRDGTDIILQPSQLVLATGMSGMPNVPNIAGAQSFAGTLCHSSQYVGAPAHRGKRCIVVGSNNSAHDICAELWEHGAQVTMIQRSPTLVARSEMLKELAWAPLYSEDSVRNGITTDIADLTTASIPLRLAPSFQRPIFAEIRRRDAAFYAALEQRGFLLTFGEDEAGIHSMYLRRGGGYYIDVGASQLIIDGAVALRSGVSIERIHPDSVTLTDGTILPADLIVFATGYGSMNEWAAQLISTDVADRVGKCWGVGSGTKYDPGPWEGELRNMWKPTHQPGLWFHGGNLMQARHYSIYLALQLKARMEGVVTPVYGMAPVHHLH